MTIRNTPERIWKTSGGETEHQKGETEDEFGETDHLGDETEHLGR